MVAKKYLVILAVVIVVAVAGGIILLSGAMSPQSSSKEYVTLQLDWLPGGHHIPLYAAKEMYWPGLGLDVNIIRGAGSADTVAKVGSGIADFGLAGFDIGLNARASDLLPLVVIFGPEQNLDTGLGWIQGRDAGRGVVDVNDLTTLAGKIYEAPLYGTVAQQLPYFLTLFDLPRDAVTMVNCDEGAIMAALISGRAI